MYICIDKSSSYNSTYKDGTKVFDMGAVKTKLAHMYKQIFSNICMNQYKHFNLDSNQFTSLLTRNKFMNKRTLNLAGTWNGHLELAKKKEKVLMMRAWSG